jgi:alkylated DNA nucleotide flippase Atl1
VSTGLDSSITGLFAKPKRGAPMEPVASLDVSPTEGVMGDANPGGLSPRQVCIAVEPSLTAQGVSTAGARANIIVSGEGAKYLDSGALLAVQDVTMRVTMKCEPCSYGAAMADAKASRFREITRYLAVVLTYGRLEVGEPLRVQPEMYSSSPDEFRARAVWALDFVPSGRVVTSLEFLTAIGAGPSYFRTLPRWLNHARDSDKPVHRVLSAGLTAPSWAPDALKKLADEGVPAYDVNSALLPLTQRLWFEHLADAAPAASREDSSGNRDLALTLFW